MIKEMQAKFNTRVAYACLIMLSLVSNRHSNGQTAMINAYGRDTTSLNGAWKVIIDPTDVGEWRQVWKERKPGKKTEFIEYSFDGGPVLQVPGDFNSQMKELAYLEGIVWYKRSFDYQPSPGKRLFVYFGAVNYQADVYLNGQHLGHHEGGFTPFQVELTNSVVESSNSLVVKVDSRRQLNGLPGTGFDWFNYGGITRDVLLVETSRNFIEDYFIQLRNGSISEVHGWVKVNGDELASQDVIVEIPQLNVRFKTKTNKDGMAPIAFSSKFELWSPESPKLYQVIVSTSYDKVFDKIGFRSISVKGNSIMLNGKEIFLKGINIHEEKAFTGGRANSINDAKVLLGWAKELGCNLVRLAHYPHSEHIVKLAEELGLMVWDELPVYQHIQFSAPGMRDKLHLSMKEMVRRDRNRCAVIFWSLSNETYPSTVGRNEALIGLTLACRKEDSTRLITSVANTQRYQNHTIIVDDPLYKYVDVVSLNEYLGWYVPWQGIPDQTRWQVEHNKPVIISEFGGEAKYGVHTGAADEAFHWNEEYQKRIYEDQIAMFSSVPNLAGVCPWILVDYRSPGRMHPQFQNGYNRKGILSESGEKKKAWFVLKDYYAKKITPAK
jgi:beta-glucuronidase